MKTTTLQKRETTPKMELTRTSGTKTTLPALTSGLFFLLASIFLVFSATANAQVTGTGRRVADTSTVIEEKLVQLALSGPRFKGLEHQDRINQYQLQSAKNSWLNILSLSVNYNEQSLKQTPTPTTAYVYPKYFFGLNIPLGTLISRTEVKAARESIEIGKSNREQLQREIRAEVLSLYRQYKAYDELIAMQNELINDLQVLLLETEEKFRKGTVTIEIYTAAEKGKNDEVARLINLELQQDLLELDIESMIGVPLESVTK